MVQISPSILAANWGQLGAAALLAQYAGASSIHIDVMDGHYVPNFGFGPYVVSALKEYTQLPLHVHMEVEHPERTLPLFLDAGADLIIIHPETCGGLDRMLDYIQSHECKVGIALHPEIAIDAANLYLDRLDLLLLMSIAPGFGGQPFQTQALERIRTVRRTLIAENYRMHVEIGVDGGITLETVPQAVEAGATLLVVGTGVYSADDPASAIRMLQRVADEAFEKHDGSQVS